MSGSREASVQWKPEWIGTLEGLLADALSATAAAVKLNEQFGTKFTRCSVIGRARRSGFALISGAIGGTPKSTKVKKPRTSVVRPRITAAAPKIPSEPYVPIETNIPPGTVALVDLEDGCKWPSGDPALFCGALRDGDRPYCAGHCRLAYRAPLPRKGGFYQWKKS